MPTQDSIRREGELKVHAAALLESYQLACAAMDIKVCAGTGTYIHMYAHVLLVVKKNKGMCMYTSSAYTHIHLLSYK